jgi:RND family efflux transporter MFP subunit
MRILSLFFMVLFSLCAVAAAAEETVQLRPYQRHLQLTGFTKAKAEVDVSGEVSGRCTKIFVDRGDTVPPSGVIAELDSTLVRLDLVKNKIAREQAARQLLLEKKTLDRYTTLMENKSAAQATFDEASLRADILELTLQDLVNEEARQKEMLDRHTLRGPPGWQVVERFVEEGTFVHQGEAVMRLGDFRQLLVSFMLSYEELDLLRKMERITFRFPELDVTAEARIYRVSPGFDAKSRKIPVDLIVAPETFSSAVEPRGGLRVNLTIVGKEETGSFVVPMSALVSRYEAHWLVKADGRRKKVILLGTDGQEAIVTGKELVSGESFLLFPADVAIPEQNQPQG